MADGTYRGRWVDAVYRSPRITDAVRVALLALAVDMDDSGRASVPRSLLAERLGRSTRRMDDRVKAAVDAGFLERVTRGQKGVTAVYTARVPGLPSTTPGGRAETVQHDDPQRAERKSQHAAIRRAEKPSTTPGGRAETASARHPGVAPNKGNGEGETNGEDAVVVQLFNEEKNNGKSPESVRAPKAAKPRADRGTRLPDDFPVTPDMAAWARDKAPSCGTTDHEAFCDYWRSQPGAKGRKLDWIATWRNWMRREQERRDRRRARPGAVAHSTTDARVAQAQRLKAKFRSGAAGGELT